VRSSYAGRKGLPRNVGVIGVAVFREREQPQIIVEQPVWDAHRGPRHDSDWGGRAADGEEAADRPTATSPAPSSGRASGGGAAAKSRASESGGHWHGGDAPAPPVERPGLGTGFGEHRHSAVTWTRFERESPTQPTALAELRYNDATGLAALGVPIQPQLPDADEMATRETADPFPGTRFARPPR
jgi:hypothetical protein